MAIEDIGFYTITGEEITRNSLVEQMINYYILKMDAGETKVTDFNEGSEIRNLLEAFAVDVYTMMEEQNQLLAMGFVETADGEFLDKHGANPLINLERDTGMEASGFVTFSTNEPVLDDTVIPEGTIVVNSETGVEYATSNDAIIEVNEDNVTVHIESLTTGEDGNCDIGEIDTITELLADIPTISVTNEDAITGGTEYEEDDEYRERLLNYVQQNDFGSLPYYIKLGSDVEGVHDINLFDDPNEVYTKIVLVNGKVKPTPEEVLANVLKVFTDTNNIVIGHKFNVDKPDYIEVTLTIDLTVEELLPEDQINEVITDIFNGGIGSYTAGFEYDGLYMGDNLTGEMLTSSLSLLDGVHEVKVYANGSSSELDTIEVAENEVCRLMGTNINQTLAE